MMPRLFKITNCTRYFFISCLLSKVKQNFYNLYLFMDHLILICNKYNA